MRAAQKAWSDAIKNISKVGFAKRVGTFEFTLSLALGAMELRRGSVRSWE